MTSTDYSHSEHSEEDSTKWDHLNAIQHRLFNEEQRLKAAKTPSERQMRQAWVDGIKREEAAEYKFLGITPTVIQHNEMTLDDVFNEMDELGL